MTSKTLKWVTSRGSKIKAILHYESAFLPRREIDDGWEGFTKDAVAVTAYAELYVNGQHFGRVSSEVGGFRAVDPDHPCHQNKEEKEAAARGCTIFCVARSEKPVPGKQIYMDGITYKEIEAAWDELIELGDDEDVRKFKAAERAAKIKKEVSEARETLRHAKTTINIFGHYPTPEEARAWRIRYNNVNNEGGEGYVPTVVTRSQVERAEDTLRRHGAAFAQ